MNGILLDHIAMLLQKLEFSEVDLIFTTGLLIKVMYLKNFQRELTIEERSLDARACRARARTNDLARQHSAELRRNASP